MVAYALIPHISNYAAAEYLGGLDVIVNQSSLRNLIKFVLKVGQEMFGILTLTSKSEGLLDSTEKGNDLNYEQ